MERSRLKELRYENDPTTKGKRTEKHHIQPRYENPNSTEIFVLTRPEHAYIHYLMAKNGENVNGNYWAVRQITKRMDSVEIIELNNMIKVRSNR